MVEYLFHVAGSGRSRQPTKGITLRRIVAWINHNEQGGDRSWDEGFTPVPRYAQRGFHYFNAASVCWNEHGSNLSHQHPSTILFTRAYRHPPDDQQSDGIIVIEYLSEK